MSYEAKIYRVLIASPSDVEEERDIAVKTIQEWNDLNSHERQIVLLPLRWETHTAPEYGKRPQEIINKQMVDHCDLLIGIFWTRIGSPTGVKDSGTLEEIDRVATAGKPVMLYFSKVKKAPDDIDVEQLAKLREFKKNTYPKALIETYTSQIEFRDKFSKHIEMQLRNLIKNDSNGISGKLESDLLLEFSDVSTLKNLGCVISIKTIFFNLARIDSLPDYKSKEKDKEDESNDTDSGIIAVFGSSRSNKDYYREMAEYLVTKNMFKPINFWLQNTGSLGARDLYVDMTASASVSGFKILSSDEFDITPPTKSGGFATTSIRHFYGDGPFTAAKIKNREDGWNITFELRALQPKREICPDFTLFVGSESSGEVSFKATIYADSLPEPIHHSLTLSLDVEVIDVDATKFLQKQNELPKENPKKKC